MHLDAFSRFLLEIGKVSLQKGLDVRHIKSWEREGSELCSSPNVIGSLSCSQLTLGAFDKSINVGIRRKRAKIVDRKTSTCRCRNGVGL